MPINLNKPIEPDIDELTFYLKGVNERGWYTNFGPLHEKLTKELEEYLNVENLLLVANGTLALQVASETLGVKSALTTPFSFVATSSALLWQKIELGYCDIDESSYNISPTEIERTLIEDNEYDAIVATHVYGNPCDLKALENLASKYNKKIIYDAAHCFGVNVGNDSILSFGDASTLSFHATKIFHTIEGGAIVFKHRKDYEKAKELISFGSKNLPGINAKLNEYQCAVGLTLLRNIKQVIEHRRSLFVFYRDRLEGVADMPLWYENTDYNGAYMPIFIPEEEKQDALLRKFDENNIQSRRYFSPSLDQLFPNCSNYGCTNSHLKANGTICLPLHYYMTQSDVDIVCDLVEKVLEN